MWWVWRWLNTPCLWLEGDAISCTCIRACRTTQSRLNCEAKVLLHPSYLPPRGSMGSAQSHPAAGQHTGTQDPLSSWTQGVIDNRERPGEITTGKRGRQGWGCPGGPWLSGQRAQTMTNLEALGLHVQIILGPRDMGGSIDHPLGDTSFQTSWCPDGGPAQITWPDFLGGQPCPRPVGCGQPPGETQTVLSGCHARPSRTHSERQTCPWARSDGLIRRCFYRNSLHA